MLIMIIGVVILGLGIYMARNPEMDRLLKLEDHDTWKRVMSPSENGYATTFGTVQLFSWVLSHGYENSSSMNVKSLGPESLSRAKTAKYLMVVGVVLLVIGFFSALLFRV